MRTSTRTVAAEATMNDWLKLIQSEYLEIPGLHLTTRQIQRLWGLDPAMCDAIIEALVEMKFLRLGTSDGYVRADA